MVQDEVRMITRAYWAVGDYFSRLGGAARYFDMPESDIPLIIGCELASKISQDFDASEYLPDKLVSAAEPIFKDMRAQLDQINAEPRELIGHLTDFLSYIDSKYQPEHRSYRWNLFLTWAYSLTR